MNKGLRVVQFIDSLIHVGRLCCVAFEKIISTFARLSVDTHVTQFELGYPNVKCYDSSRPSLLDSFCVSDHDRRRSGTGGVIQTWQDASGAMLNPVLRTRSQVTGGTVLNRGFSSTAAFAGLENSLVTGAINRSAAHEITGDGRSSAVDRDVDMSGLFQR